MKNLIVALLGSLIMSCAHGSDENLSSWLILNAEIVDGTGDARLIGDVRISDAIIQEIGNLAPRAGEKTWNADGLILTPGFIDPHSHHADEIGEAMAYPSVLAQGITTVIGGLDGFSHVAVKDVFAAFESSPAAFNLAYYGGHNSYRAKVMGEDYKRPATLSELMAMQALLAADLKAGAVGLSTGLEYEPGLYASTDEVVELAKTASAAGARYASHIRSEDVSLFRAVEELIEIADRADLPVHYSHMKLAMNALWGRAGEIVSMIEAARDGGQEITGDIYPYNGWQSTMLVLLPERNIYDRAAYEYALSKIAAPETILFTRYDLDPSVVGKTLADLAHEQSRNPVDIYMEMAQRAVSEGGEESIIGRNISNQDIATFIQAPFASFSSDGGVDDRHPRGQGAFPRALRLYVQEEKRLSLETAVSMMTGRTADAIGLSDRGRIAPGMAADLVLFDLSKITDRSDFDNPIQYAEGIEAIWVNGQLVWKDGAATMARPGKALRRTKPQ